MSLFLMIRSIVYAAPCRWCITLCLACWSILLPGLTVCSVSHAQVIISEIMYNPDGADKGGAPNAFNKEWVEIFNTGGTAVDLSGWVFEDSSDPAATTPIPGGTFLDPGQALVLVGDAATFDSQWGMGINRIQLGDFPSLSNSPTPVQEILALRNSAGSIQDFVNYDDSDPWPTDISDGPSIYVRPDFLNTIGNNDGANWNSSTPGIDGASYSQEFPFGEKASPGIVATEPTIFPPFTPSPDAAWSIVVFPDTQNYVKTQVHLPQFVDMAEWVRDHHNEFNVQLVIQEGDIVNKNANENPSSGENPSTLQWQNAHSTMSILNGQVPYIMAVGNHDTGTNNAENRSTRLNEFFSPSDNPLNDPAQGGILKGVMEFGHLENAYFELTAPDGRELLIFSLAWDPQQDQLSWANQIADQPRFADHTAMLVIHDYLENDQVRSINGDNVWEEFVSENENFEMVFNGHDGGDGTGYLASTGDGGNLVNQMLFNTQFEGNGGNGWIRMLEFLDDGTTVHARTFSPSFGYLRTDPENDFFFQLTPLFALDGDFNNDGTYDGVDVDALVAEVIQVAGGNLPDTNFDLNGDGTIDDADLVTWLAEAGSELGFAGPILLGDANVDGVVDGADFLLWNANKFSLGALWTGGDFNADDVSDGADFLLWNANKFTSSDLLLVPEPGNWMLILSTLFVTRFVAPPLGRRNCEERSLPI